MVVVYLKNGEKAPMPDANYVKVEPSSETSAQAMLRCFFGNTEVGLFKWDEVAGYTVAATPLADGAGGSYEAWNRRLET